MSCANKCGGCSKSSSDVDRFDLEQQILQCWNITDDLKELDDDYVKALVVIYEKKFNKLWDMFESLVENKRLI